MTLQSEDAYYRTISRDIGIAWFVIMLSSTADDTSRVFGFRFSRDIGTDLASLVMNGPGVVESVKAWVVTETSYAEVRKAIEQHAQHLRHDWFECQTQLDRQNVPALIDKLLTVLRSPADELKDRLKGKFSDLFPPPPSVGLEASRPLLRLIDD